MVFLIPRPQFPLSEKPFNLPGSSQRMRGCFKKGSRLGWSVFLTSHFSYCPLGGGRQQLAAADGHPVPAFSLKVPKLFQLPRGARDRT